MSRWRVALALAVALHLASAGIPALLARASAHPLTEWLTQTVYGTDPTCAGHWLNNTMLWHWGNELDDGHHLADRESFKRAAAQWESQTNPNSPWNAVKDLDAITHPNMVFFSGDAIGRGRIAQEDVDSHIPRVIELWVRHDIEELDCGEEGGFQPCSWYNGTGTPGTLKLDEWGVWQEELGHAQNISHHEVIGHLAHDLDHAHTMTGYTLPGDTTKRFPLQHENQHACYGYQVSHNNSCSL